MSGNPIERVFWSVCLMVVTSLAVYLCRNFYLKYATFGVRTEVIEAADKGSLPVMIVCTNLLDHLNCHKNMTLIHADTNEPSDCSQTFNDKSLFVEYSDIIDTNKTIQNCVALKQGLLFEHGLTVAWNGVLSVYVVTTDHSKAILDLTYHSALPIIQGSLGFQRLILSIDETITKRRLPHPYPSNCTFGKGF